MSKQRFTAGDTEQVGDDGKFEAGIHDLEGDTHWRKEPQTWWQRIVAYGETAEEANALRDEILTALSEHKALAGQQQAEATMAKNSNVAATPSEDGWEVVGYLDHERKTFSQVETDDHRCPLIYMANFERIVAAKDAEISRLRVDNEALAANLRGKHSTTGATYTHLIAERDELRAQLAEKDKRLRQEQAYVSELAEEHTQLEARLAQLAAQQAAVPVGWTLAADQLPGSGKAILAFYLNSHGKGRRIRAEYIARWTVQAEGFDPDPDTECVEYSEQDDAYYILEGWYELIDNWDDYSRIAVTDGVVTHWMDMPTAPAAPQQGVVMPERDSRAGRLGAYAEGWNDHLKADRSRPANENNNPIGQHISCGNCGYCGSTDLIDQDCDALCPQCNDPSAQGGE